MAEEDIELLKLRAKAKAKAERERAASEEQPQETKQPQEDISMKEALLPQFSSMDEQNSFMEKAGALGLDLLSLPGRNIVQGIGKGQEMIPPMESIDPKKRDKKKKPEIGDGLDYTERMAFINQGQDLKGDPSMATEIITDPALLPSMATGGLAGGMIKGAGPMMKALKYGVGGLVEGGVGGGIHQGQKVMEGGEFSGGELMKEAAFGAGMGAGSAAPSEMLKLMGSAARKISSKLSGASEEALKMYGTGRGIGPNKMRALAGRTREIGLSLLDALGPKFDDFIKPEMQRVNQALLKMPPMNVNKPLAFLKSKTIRDNPSPAEQKINKLLEPHIKWLQGFAPKVSDVGGKARANMNNLTPKKYMELRRKVDSDIKWDDEGAAALNNILKDVRGIMRGQLETGATATGNVGYADDMKSVFTKLGKRDDMLELFGKSAKTRNLRAQALMSSILSPKQEAKQEILRDLTEVLGVDFMKRAKITRLASEMGLVQRGDLTADFFPTQTTGRSTLGVGAGGGQIATGLATGRPGLVASGIGTLGLSSPNIGAKMAAGLEGLSRGVASKPQVSKGLSTFMRTAAFGNTNE